MTSKSKDIAAAIRAKLARDPELASAIDAERLNMDVASVIYAARTQAGLSQAELAARAGMHQSAIARMESADYEGHSIATLKKIANALGRRLSLDFVPASADAVPASNDTAAPAGGAPVLSDRQ